MNHIKKNYNIEIIIGISYGAFIMKKYLYIDNTIKCAISISSPYNLRKTFDYWNASFIRKQLYDDFFVKHYKKSLQNNIKYPSLIFK